MQQYNFPTIIYCGQGAVEAFAKTLGDTPIRISVLGCPVNGPGEAREADIGVAGGRHEGFIYRRGVQVRKVTEGELLPALKEEVHRFLEEQKRVALQQ